MTWKVGAIVSRLELDKAKWEQAIKSVKDDQRSLQGFVVRNSKEIKDLGKGMTVAGASITAAFGVLLKKTADAGDQINDLSQRTGIGTELLSAYKLAADKSGSSLEGFATGMRGLSRVMDDVKSGGQEAVGAFKDVGVSATDTEGNLRPLDQVMLDIADRFAAMPDGPEKSALAMRLFGKSGAELIPMLNMGRQGLEENAEAARRLGIVFTQEAATACDEFNDSVADLQGAAGGLGKQIALQLMPHVQSLIEGAKDIVVKVKDWAAAHPGLAEGLSKTALGLGILASAVGPVLIALPSLVNWIQKLKALSATPIVITIMVAIPVLTKAAADFNSEFRNMLDSMRESGASGFEAFFEGLNSGWRKVALGIKDSNIVLSEANALAKLYAEEGGRGMKDVLLEEAAAAGTATTAFTSLGIKTKTELTKELKEAEAALRQLKASTEATPGQVKVLEEKIASLKEAMTGVTIETRSLKDQLGLTFKADTNKRIEQLNDALLLYRGKLTKDQVDAIRAEIDKLAQSTRVNLAPAADLVAQHVDAGLTKLEELALKANQEIESSGNYMAENMESDLADITSGWKNVPEGAKDAADETKGYFDGLFNDIAQGFGSTIQTWLSGATTFKDFMKGIWGDIKDAIFSAIGEQVTKKLMDLFDSVIGKTKEVGKSITDNISGVLGGSGAAAGQMAGSFLSAASSIANVVTAVASVVSLLKSPPTGAGDGMGRVVERQDQQTSLLTIIRDFLWNDQRWGWQTSIKVQEHLTYDVLSITNSWLQKISTGISDLVKKIQPAASGFEGTISHPTLFLAHPKEHVSITPTKTGSPGPAGASNITLNISISTIDGADLETITRRKVVPVLQNVLDHYGLHVPAGAIA